MDRNCCKVNQKTQKDRRRKDKGQKSSGFQDDRISIFQDVKTKRRVADRKLIPRIVNCPLSFAHWICQPLPFDNLLPAYVLHARLLVIFVIYENARFIHIYGTSATGSGPFTAIIFDYAGT